MIRNSSPNVFSSFILFCIIFCPCQPHTRILVHPLGIKPTSSSLEAPGLPRKSHFPVFSILFSFLLPGPYIKYSHFWNLCFCLFHFDFLAQKLCRRNSLLLIACASQFVFHSNHVCGDSNLPPNRGHNCTNFLRLFKL